LPEKSGLRTVPEEAKATEMGHWRKRIPRRVAVIAACVIAAAVAVALLGSRFSVDANAYKGRFETAASGPLGLHVAVDGGLRVAFNGDILLTMRDVRVRNSDGAEVLRAEAATIAVGLVPLLFNQCHIHRIALTHPVILIERGRDGLLNWNRREAPRGMPPVLARAALSLREGNVHYKDEASGAAIEAAGVSAEIRDLRENAREVSSPIGTFSFRGRLGCTEIQSGSVSVADLTVVASARNGTLELSPIAMRVFGGKGLASLHAEFSDSIPSYRLRCALAQFGINQCLQTLSPDTIATGAMNFAANLSWRGRGPAEWQRSAEGDVDLHGQQIMLCGHDLDEDFARFESSQNLDLMDVGSVFFVGPLGILATKGFDFARLIGHSKGGTQIGSIVSSWGVRGGKLEAKDVAMATTKNRLALRGRLDFVHEEFDSVTIALIDKDGCAEVRQELRGTFQKPELTKPTILGSLLGPARKVFTTVKDLLPGKCTPFYEGSVKHPES
jgi:AsmA-like protein